MGKVKKSRFSGKEDDEPLNTELEAEEDADTEDASDSDSPKEFEVLEILEHRRREDNPKKRDYLIRWTAPYDNPECDSWEPAENLFCELLIQAYWEKRKTLKAQGDNGDSSEPRRKKKKKKVKEPEKSPDRTASESDGEKPGSYKELKDLGSRPHLEKAKRDSQFKKLKEAVRKTKIKKAQKKNLEREPSEEREPVERRISPRRLNSTAKIATKDSPVEAPVATPKSNGLSGEKPLKKVKENGMGRKGPVNILASTPRKRARLLELISSEDEDSGHAVDNPPGAYNDVPPDDKPSQKDVNRDLFGSSLSSLSPSPPVPSARSSRSKSRKNSRDSSLPANRKSSPIDTTSSNQNKRKVSSSPIVPEQSPSTKKNSGRKNSRDSSLPASVKSSASGVPGTQKQKNSTSPIVSEQSPNAKKNSDRKNSRDNSLPASGKSSASGASGTQKRKNSTSDVSEQSPKKNSGPISWTEGDYIHLIIGGEPFRYNVNIETNDAADRRVRKHVLRGVSVPSVGDNTEEEGTKTKKKKKRTLTTVVDEVQDLPASVDDKSSLSPDTTRDEGTKSKKKKKRTSTIVVDQAVAQELLAAVDNKSHLSPDNTNDEGTKSKKKKKRTPATVVDEVVSQDLSATVDNKPQRSTVGETAEIDSTLKKPEEVVPKNKKEVRKERERSVQTESAKLTTSPRRLNTTAERAAEAVPVGAAVCVPESKGLGEETSQEKVTENGVAVVVTCEERKIGIGEDLVQPDVSVVEPTGLHVDVMEAALGEPVALEHEEDPDRDTGSQENISVGVGKTDHNNCDKMTSEEERLFDADCPYQTVAISPDTYGLLASTPLAELIVENINCAEDHVNKVSGFCVQFKGFPGMVFLPEETMRDYFLENLLDFYEALLTPPTV